MNLFAYGTLLCADILHKVTGCRPAHAPAALRGYRRHALTDEVYPAIVAHEGAAVAGVIYFDVPAGAWSCLDRFEGEMYARRIVRVLCEDGTSVDAATYVIKPEFAYRLAPSEWSVEEFLASGRKKFEAEYSGFDEVGNRRRRGSMLVRNRHGTGGREVS